MQTAVGSKENLMMRNQIIKISSLLLTLGGFPIPAFLLFMEDPPIRFSASICSLKSMKGVRDSFRQDSINRR
jgi:hypothetical protein